MRSSRLPPVRGHQLLQLATLVILCRDREHRKIMWRYCKQMKYFVFREMRSNHSSSHYTFQRGKDTQTEGITTSASSRPAHYHTRSSHQLIKLLRRADTYSLHRQVACLTACTALFKQAERSRQPAICARFLRRASISPRAPSRASSRAPLHCKHLHDDSPNN